MAGFAAQSSTTSAISAAKLRESKSAVKAKPLAGAGRILDPLFAELARLAEMSAVERKLRERGFRCIAGTDEVGRGALAGPVVAAVVVLHHDSSLFGVNDSKLLTLDSRKLTCDLILKHARSVSIGVVEPHIIDQINILEASKRAMVDAVQSLPIRPDMLLLDAVYLERLEMPQIALIKGDRRSITIAAASIVAKVYRDMLMESYDALYPKYDFCNNRGYGTESHMKALDTYGVTPIHRKSFERSAAEVSLFG